MMTQPHVHRFTHSLARTRRLLLGGVLAITGGGLAAYDTEARKARKRRKKPTPNSFGCLNVGKLCKRAEQCCSNLCKGKKGKKRCRSHDTGGCPAGHDPFAGDPVVSCLTSSNELGKCATTTGNAGYCLGGGDCRPCLKDVDCQALCGPQATCVVSPVGCSGVTGTVCAGPDEVVCPL